MLNKGTRFAVDIGGTFTDIVLEQDNGAVTSAKYLTTHQAPEVAVLNGMADLLRQTGVPPRSVRLVIHGTTLATNALIERKGARVALVTTAGFRDTLEIAHEHRFEVSDLYMRRPPALVPRHLRLEARERLAADGSVLLPLDEQSVRDLAPQLAAQDIEAVAIGFLHSYANGEHERRAGELLRQALPHLKITLSHQVCPEIREYERISTACANAYVQPIMDRYLHRLAQGISRLGIGGKVMLMMSSGGLTTLEQACAFPVMLVESGPAGGAVLAAHVARQLDIAQAIAFDMGGTTAKLVLIDDGQPQYGRQLEVARAYRFLKGSGMPLRIPVIDMVEIGAGGGSLGYRDALDQVAVGPESCGSEPGPASYGRGGTRPAVTDADLVLGKIDPTLFAGGKIALDKSLAIAALRQHVSAGADENGELAAMAMVEVVDENMANAASVHATDNGAQLEDRAMIAFGGAAPLHAARIAQKLGIRRVVIPSGAGVGAAHGFLLAPVSSEVVRTHLLALAAFDAGVINRLFAGLRHEAEETVYLALAANQTVSETRVVYMRYRGQGHEIAVPLPARAFRPDDHRLLRRRFEAEYIRHFGRIIPNMEIECLTWTLRLAEVMPAPSAPRADLPPGQAPAPAGHQTLIDLALMRQTAAAVYHRHTLQPGMSISGPAIIAEAQTNTLVPVGFRADIHPLHHILLTQEEKV
ncbi:hydantoinase/oxoprolinase family protein [Brenneria sp. g21c3]|uniref:hydantoinase/oxoprolinase family protein n=1 Tax=Brenneria sp. g21c3 TaxID=3093893 RepID=UPI002EAC851C|nr:hydantoinase/oxoprolinase family protein [Brenneria sp. g21c3]